MTLAREIWSLLDRRQRRALLGMLFLCLLSACATAGGVAAVVPFLAFLADPQQIGGHAALRWAQQLLGIERGADMLLLLGCVFFAAVLLSNCISLLEMVMAEKYSHSLAGALQLRLFDTYLRLDGGCQARGDSASLAANILQEVYRLTNGIIYSGLMLVSQALASALIVCFVVLVNPVVALSAVLALGAAYLFIYLVVRRRLASYGEEFTRNWHERARLVNESLGALKEILLMRNQAFFTERFAAQTRRIERAQVGIAAISRSPKYILECVTAACLVGAALWLSRTPGAGNWLVQLSLLGISGIPAVAGAAEFVPERRENSLQSRRVRKDRARPAPRARKASRLTARPLVAAAAAIRHRGARCHAPLRRGSAGGTAPVVARHRGRQFRSAGGAERVREDHAGGCDAGSASPAGRARGNRWDRTGRKEPGVLAIGHGLRAAGHVPAQCQPRGKYRTGNRANPYR